MTGRADLAKRQKHSARKMEIHHARVLLQEARNRAAMAPIYGDHHRILALVLLEWAGNARRRAMQIGNERPRQADLFERPAA
jgi:hypothetical protein